VKFPRHAKELTNFARILEEFTAIGLVNSGPHQEIQAARFPSLQLESIETATITCRTPPQ